jgi:hypothetical protein
MNHGHKIRKFLSPLSSSFTLREVTVQYVPQTRESRLIKIPIVKRVRGGDLDVVSESDKNIYREIEETMKKESDSKRDEW